MKYMWLAIALLLVACSSDNPAQLEGQNPDRDTPPATSASLLAEVPRDDFRLHVDSAQALEGQMAFTHDDDLYLAGFDGSPARLLAEDVQIVLAAPDGTMVLFRMGDTFHHLNTATGVITTIPVAEYSSHLEPGDWSPNTQHVILNWLNPSNRTVAQWILSTTGELLQLPMPEIYLVPRSAPPGVDIEDVPVNRLEPVPLEQYRRIYWLDDNRLLSIFYNYELEQPEAVTEIIDPATATFIPTDKADKHVFARVFQYLGNLPDCCLIAARDLVAESFDFRLASGPLAPVGTRVAPLTGDYQVEAVFNNADGLLCAPLQVALKPLGQAFVPATIYEGLAVDISPLVLDDVAGHVTFVQTVAPLCDENDIRQQVVQIQLDTPYTVQELHQTPNLGMPAPPASLVSAPDHQHVVWSSHNRLLLTRLDTGETWEVMAFSQGTVTPLTWH